MPRAPSRQANSQTFTLILLVVIVAVLYLAKEVLIPLATAGLLTFILAPAIDRLERWGLGRVPSIALVVVLAFSVVGGLGYVVAQQFVDLADELPTYQRNLVDKAHDLTARMSQAGPVAKIERALGALKRELAGEQPAKSDPAAATTEPDSSAPPPVPVEVVQPSTHSFGFLTDLLAGVVGWFATLGIILLFLVFMLVAREDLRNRIIRLIGSQQITVTTQALDEAAGRISRYLRMQLIINASFGLMLAIGLFVIGLPNAILWGVLAGLLRYVPYLGAWIAAAIAVALSLAAFDTWTQPLATIALFAVTELITGNVIEPVLFHSSTGVSTMGVLVAAVFWTWLWGPLGLVLSMPLTVCVVVIGRYVPQLEFLSVLLGDEAALTPATEYYHRLLVDDVEEARELVEGHLKEHSLDDLFDTMLLPALVMAEQDSQKGVLEQDKREFILDSIREQVEELAEASLASDATRKLTQASSGLGLRGIVCLPARDAADEIAGMMLQTRLAQRGISVELLPMKMLTGEVMEQVANSGADLIVISTVPPFAVRHARYLCKRLQAYHVNLRVLVGVWCEERRLKQIDERLRAAGAEKVVNNLSGAADYIERFKPAPVVSAAEPQSQSA